VLGKYFLKLGTLYREHRFERIAQKIYKVSREKRKKKRWWLIRFKPLLEASLKPPAMQVDSLLPFVLELHGERWQ